MQVAKYKYDKRGRLIGVSFDYGGEVNYAFDAAGNRISVSELEAIPAGPPGPEGPEGPQGPEGSSPLSVATGTLSATQISSLSNTFSVTLVSSPGPTKMIVPMFVILVTEPGTNAWANGSNINLNIGSTTIISNLMTNTLVQSASKQRAAAAPPALSGAVSGLSGNDCNIRLGSTTHFSGGNGTIRWTLVYYVQSV